MSIRFSGIIIFILLTIFILACGNNKHSKVDSEQNNSEIHAHQIADSISGMQLNDGQKWLMDEHTRSSFKKMASTFSASDHSSIEGLQGVGVELRGQVNELLKGCTMDGAAHDQLHVFMMGYIPAVDSLSSSNNLELGQEQAIKVKEYLDAYSVYFE
ncbi:MAG: hypothetical protein D8M58_14450 [Calditrichaeota bacterium]|nr:MAG: hypothetical protein DWQ03_15690 [Calditrichota bacterium]MBL1206602.1 hypothetical protein [Calditrichota bacterium]NOG46429.1 hypothetical protein [Calditrichota bacterium]